LTAYFIGEHLSEPGWFPSAIYGTFDGQARDLLDGKAHPFRIDDPSRTDEAIYPPGYSLWIALVYSITGNMTPYSVQAVQATLDSLAVLTIVLTAAHACSWRVAIAIGFLAALSPLLAIYGATPLADAPTSWLVTSGMLFMVIAVKK